MMNTLKISLSALLLLLQTSCITTQPVTQENLLGLYEITSRQCLGSIELTDNCNKTRFIELVNGQFFGIQNNELGLVFWRGEKGEELLYQATKLVLNKSNSFKNHITISNDENVEEVLQLTNGLVSSYRLSLNKPAENSVKTNFIDYQLRPVSRSSLPEFRMNYPGND